MKKLVFLLLGIILCGMISAQKPSIWKPVPKDYFSKDRGVNSEWLWRFSAQLTATELQWNKDTKQFVSLPLSSVGPGIGYKHFTVIESGEPYSDFSANLVLLLGTDIFTPDPAQIKAAVTITAFQYISVGACYTFNNENHFGILLGASVNF